MPITIDESLMQWAVPAADIPNTGTPVFPNNFLSPPWFTPLADLSDATIIQTGDLSDLGAAYRFECSLSSVAAPGYTTNHFVRMRAQKSDSGTQTLGVELRQSGTVLHSWSIALSTTLATYDEPLSPSIVAAIASYGSGLSLRGNAVHISTPNRVIVAMVRFAVPPVGFAHLLPSSTGVGWDVAPIASGTYARFVSGGPGVEIVTGIEQAGAIVSTDGAGFTVKS